VATTNGKVALVTGAASGIGRATAEAFVARGYATVLVDREAKSGEKAQETLRRTGECTFLRCDVTNDDEVRGTIEQAVALYGRLDAAFNAAGVNGDMAPLAEGTIENWNRVIAIDLTGVWSCMRYEIRQMLKNGGGSIVNCASVSGLVAAEQLSPYVAAKHGVIGLTKAAAIEYIRQGIRVNAVCPGMISTPMFDSITPDVASALVGASPAGRFGTPAEIAAAVMWLSDESSSFVVGHALVADGGWTAK
jgi:NAD(P)-dependent dehydrogenase (short-subunit alcohol dehydrogenase family)